MHADEDHGFTRIGIPPGAGAAGLHLYVCPVPDAPTGYLLYSMGSDGIAGTEDDVK
jgi:hypothetical protein